MVDKVAAQEISRRIQSVEVGFSLLRVLCEHKGSMSLNEITNATGLHRSQLYRYLNSFVHLGVLMRNDENNTRWSLGPELIALGRSASDSLDLTKYAKQHLVKLRDKMNQSVGLSIWRERGAFFVQYEKSHKLINLSFDIGQYVPLYTATGKIFRAYLPADMTDELYQKEILAGNIVPSQYNLEIQQIKKNVYSIYNDDGTTAVSVPVFYQSGELAGAVTIAEIQGVLDISAQSLTAKELKQTAYDISKELGFTGEYPL